jgi:hypothetical protein
VKLGTIAVAAAIGALAAPGVTSARVKPTLHITRELPLTLVGAGFRPAESARVTIVVGQLRSVRAVRTTKRGSFTVRLLGVRLNYCAQPFSIFARGSRSGLVRFVPPVRECAAP